MEQSGCEERGKKVSDLKCEKIVLSVDESTQKPETIETRKSLEASMFASQTPAKTNEPLHAKFREGELEILERYKTIVELFDSMNCSLRLLVMRKKSPAFQNIAAQVKVLTQRKFSYGHLARIKYLLPEAIQMDKILVHDKKSLCMKPDIKIGVLFDVVEGHDEESDFIALRQVFASRLVDYFIKHPEACDIPQAILPGPFNQSKEAASEEKAGDHSMAVFCEPFNEISETIAPEPMITDQSREYLPAAIESQMLSAPSHLCPSFNRHFSRKTFSEEKVQLLASPVPASVSPSGDLHNEHLNEARTGEFPEFCSKFNFRTNLDIKSGQSRQLCIPHSKSTSFNPLPSQPINPEVSADVYTSTSPKCKPDSSAGKLLLETPAQSTPRRAMHSSDDKHKDTTGQKQTLSCKPAKRVLDFSYMEADKGASEYYEFLHDSSAQPLAGSSSLLKKVEGSLGHSSVDQKTCQSDTVHQQMSIQLPDLVSLVHHIFQSVNFSPITKEELVHKIILDSLDIVDRREVEEQIGILEKRVPDWICRLPAPSGDVLYKIKKMSDLDTVQAMVIA
ncbi:PREDICTED: CDT1-like protein b [Populus euphratica]|uniref:CDT1-like protein b n=1 Tax=Populus euphratica TaxID=75702 RepID=A0AAJ6USK6_POPEU|nr:PREDICTED: CDT1-like protein b [Populus euphratica]XP_011035405.1 PREDICTED: CDT1-like protein b [Populus euphratica]XP_011035407.1 PREDICTED: CDT1-like protein b [Populus euphratica]